MNFIGQGVIHAGCTYLALGRPSPVLPRLPTCNSELWNYAVWLACDAALARYLPQRRHVRSRFSCGWVGGARLVAACGRDRTCDQESR